MSADNVEKLAEAIVFLDPDNPVELANILRRFETIGKTAGSAQMPKAALACNACCGILEKLILNEIKDKTKAIKTIEQTVSALQDVLCRQRPEDRVRFPEALGIEDGQQGWVDNEMPTEVEQSDELINSPDSAAEDNNGEPAEKKLVCHVAGDMELLSDFVVEAREHLSEVDCSLLELEKQPDDQEALNAVFRAFHTIKGVSGYLNLKPITDLSHETENLLSQARKGALNISRETIDLLFSAKDLATLLIDKVSDVLRTGEAEFAVSDALSGLLEKIRKASGAVEKEKKQKPKARQDENDSMPRLAEFLIKSGIVSEDDVTEALRLQSLSPEKLKLGEILVRQGKASAEDISKALRNQTSAAAKAQLAEPVKVDAARLDKLLETIGEIVITETMVSQAPEIRAIKSDQIVRRLHRLDKITRELQELATSLRMVPLRSTFRRMARLARDVAKKTGKEIDFILHGEDTEIDRNVVDRLGDPLIHLVRNAIDHGLEADAEERHVAGKPARGLVELRAFQKGGNVFINIADDGKGLNKEAILAKAADQGLLSPGETVRDDELFRLILLPGFSTAKKVTDVSGRGVGMDVVNKSIEALGGRIDIKSETGKGSLFSLCLPLTLSLLEGVVVRVGSQRYILPALSISRMLRPELSKTKTLFDKKKMISAGDAMRPLFRLCDLFNIPDAETAPEKSTVILVENGLNQAAFLVDEVLGRQQIVLKPLGGGIQGLPGISGGAIMPDGRVGLVLDAGDLIDIAKKESNINQTALA